MNSHSPRGITVLLLSVWIAFPSMSFCGSPPSTYDEFENILQRYDDRVSETLTQTGAPGVALAIVYQNRVVYLRTDGVRNTETREPLDEHTVFRIASLSKGFAGVAAALAVEDGALAWDDLVQTYLPTLQLKRRRTLETMTLDHLLSQTTGAVPHAFDNLLDAGLPYEEISRRLANIPLPHPVGQVYSYQNVLFGLIAPILQNATHQSYETLVRQKIFTPLYMQRASFGYERFAQDANRADPHVQRAGHWAPTPLRSTYYTVPAAAGINASILDMAQWVRAMLGYRPDIIPQSVIEAVTAPVVSSPGELYRYNSDGRLHHASYGRGWRIFDYSGSDMVFHAGGVRGYHGQIALLPDHQVGIAMLMHCHARQRFVYDFVDLFLGLAPPELLLAN